MAEFNHNQTVSSNTWTINHNLNVNETVNDVFVDVAGDLTKSLPLNVVHTDNNTLTITFTDPQVGRVRIIG